MRSFAIGLLVGLLVAGCGNVHAQITVESVEQVCVIKPPEKIETKAGLWVVSAVAELTLTPAAIVRLSGLDGFKVSAKPILLVTGQKPVSVQSMDAATWLVSGSPRVFLSVTAIDFERQRFENEVIIVEVSKRPDPDEPDEPNQPDDDPMPVGPNGCLQPHRSAREEVGTRKNDVGLLIHAPAA
ncbi:MAG: hypothetical protein AAFX06_24115 [Planctomycetota bacterium]